MPTKPYLRRSARRHRKGYSTILSYGDASFVLAEDFRELKLAKDSKSKATLYNLKKAEKMIIYLMLLIE